MWRKVAFAFIIISLVFSVSDYFYTMHASYNKYLEGEYFFRYKATTILAMDQDAWFDSVENFEYVSSLDFSDPKIMLLYGGEMEVYAVNPHDGVCTVLYGSQTIDDFPVSNLRFADGEFDYFNGTKQLTYDEYIEYVKSLTPDQLESKMVSSSQIASFKGVARNILILIGVEGAIIIILLIMRKMELSRAYDVLLIAGALYGIFFEAISAYIY